MPRRRGFSSACPGAVPEPGARAATRCGFVALLGAPNAGKSTLLNRLVGTKVSIVTPKVQTTRSRVLGIAIVGGAQIVFIDTPGVFAPRTRFDRAMVRAAWDGARDADSTVLVVDARRGLDDNARLIVDRAAAANRPLTVALNKIDLIDRRALLGLAAAFAERRTGNGAALAAATFMISALTGDGVDDLQAALAAAVPAGPWHYPADQAADMPARLLAAEITREKLFLQLNRELPYAAAVETEAWTERRDGGVRIDQAIHVQRESQRMIVLGKGGRRIKAIGSEARAELKELFDRPVHLFLHVKVRRDWREDPERYRDLGLDYDV